MDYEAEAKTLRVQAKELATKILEHYAAIESIRREDRDKWKEFSKRLEDLEALKSERGKKRKYRRKMGDVHEKKEPDVITAEPVQSEDRSQ